MRFMRAARDAIKDLAATYESRKDSDAALWRSSGYGELAELGSVRNVVGIRSGIISEKLIISYYAARSNC
jgi:hypothetical protein